MSEAAVPAADAADADACDADAQSGQQRSILKLDVEAQPGRKRAVRVEICEHRNKLIFYRQDKGWKVGYFAEHLHRRSKAAAQAQNLAIDVPNNRDGCHRADADAAEAFPTASNRSSPLSNQSSLLSNQSSPLSNQSSPLFIHLGSPPSNQSSPPSSPGSPASNRLLLVPPPHRPDSPPPRGPLARLASREDLEISVSVIHACTHGCYAINS